MTIVSSTVAIEGQECEITIGELLETPATVDCTIRFICAARKALSNSDTLNSDEADLELEIGRLFHKIGQNRRNQAFEAGAENFKEKEAKSLPKLEIVKPIAPPAPPKKIAPVLNRQRLNKILTDTILPKLKAAGTYSFTYKQIKSLVQEEHLRGGFEFAETDLIESPSNGETRWSATLGNALVALRDKDVICYRKTIGDYVIF